MSATATRAVSMPAAAGDRRSRTTGGSHRFRTTGTRGRVLVPLAVAAAVLAVVAGAVWALTAPPPRPAAGPGELALPGGLVRIEQVVSAARPMHAMPGMGIDQDPVADGERRISIDVTLYAIDTMPYEIDAFVLHIDDVGALTPHRAVLPGNELPAGSQLTGTVIFDVPEDATSGRLSYGGKGATDVPLPREAEQFAPAGPRQGPAHH
ncbi:hypothetical protein [Georgenia yuyongxinii]|uniref:Uncharacterized protein n=1 Tax=Georgenia yuyongxinii TaxID=2589797 RepID=A0A552WPW1_9MICO|nr:hypothetical protein [Georgenia yuyongxinii]TRW44714.1 hypothetical protein FJ693_12435 [Georgenia yuyongxinii]